jgi:HK97 gp10 family phage protein
MSSQLRIYTRVIGADELTKLLKQLEPRYFRQAVRKGLNNGSKTILRQAKANVQVETGTLRRALGRKIVAHKKRTGYLAIIGPRMDAKRPTKTSSKRKVTFARKVRRARWVPRDEIATPYRYAHLVEKGTRPHAVGRGSSLRSGAQVGIRHPGAKPYPFLEPAYDSTRVSVSNDIRTQLQLALADIKKLRRK